MRGANIQFPIKSDGSEEKMNMLYCSLKFYGRSISTEAENNIEGVLKEKNKLTDFYRQLINDQKDMIKVQQDQIKSLNERLQMLEKLLFNVNKNR